MPTKALFPIRLRGTQEKNSLVFIEFKFQLEESEEMVHGMYNVKVSL